MSIAEALITAEEFAEMPDDGRMTELVRGRIIELPWPKSRHGQICSQVTWIVGSHVEAHDLGTILAGGVGIITRRNPDTVRCADFAYFFHNQNPRSPASESYCEDAPELVIEVREPSDRWLYVFTKMTEYLNLGALVVCILDADTRSAHLYYPDQPGRILNADDELTFPECLPDFRVPVRNLFE